MILNVSTPSGYDIACALRGPDGEYADLGRCLKSVLTAPIRDYVGVRTTRAEVHSLQVCDLIDLQYHLVTNPDIRVKSLCHYLSHVVAALDALGAEQEGHPLFKLRLLAVALTDLSMSAEYKRQGADTMTILEEMIKKGAESDQCG